MSTKRVHNFNPGPATLPLEAIQRIRDEFMDFEGMSVLEISHRSKTFAAILDEAHDLITELMCVPKNYHILFLSGGASLQFAMVPMNLMNKSADYAITGIWSKKAFAEAKHFGEPKIIFSSEDTNFNRVPSPEEIKLNDDADYLHITTNNTIYGTQYHSFPKTGNIPLVADMSSDILSRSTDVSQFGLIYAGAQKNLGPAGVTLVIIREDLVNRSYRNIPTTLKYSTHVESKSLFNTPPVFSVYAMTHVLKWFKKQGGVAAIEKINQEKANIIYDVLDSSSFYKNSVEKQSRSFMNITFTLPSQELTEKFIAGAKEKSMAGLKGHRSAGGIRASIYNALPFEAVKDLVQFMKEFERNS